MLAIFSAIHPVLFPPECCASIFDSTRIEKLKSLHQIAPTVLIRPLQDRSDLLSQRSQLLLRDLRVRATQDDELGLVYVANDTPQGERIAECVSKPDITRLLSEFFF